MTVEERKRVTITLQGDILEWIDSKIEERVFHNYQHAVELSLMKVYQEDLPRFRHYNVYDDHATIYDNLKKRIVDVYFRNGSYCELCEETDCEHTRFALTLPKVVEPLQEKGWVIRDGKVVSTPK